MGGAGGIRASEWRFCGPSGSQLAECGSTPVCRPITRLIHCLHLKVRSKLPSCLLHWRQMRFDLITIFPEFFAGPFDHGILRRARETGLVEVNVQDLRVFTNARHRTVEDP